MTDKEKLDAIRTEIHRIVDVRGYDREIANDLLAFMDSLPNEPVSEELEEAATQYGIDEFPSLCNGCKHVPIDAFKAGAKWQKEYLWKPADGDNLPEIDKEVIALIEENGHYKVVFAHRPPEYWDGKNILTNKVTRNYTKRYDKGGWNIPNVKWWLDCLMPIKEYE